MRRWFLRTALAVVVYLAVTTAYLEWKHARIRADGEAQLRDAVAEADAADPHWRWDDLDAERRKVVPDDENIAAQVMRFAAIERSNARREPKPKHLAAAALEHINESPNVRLDDEDAKVVAWALRESAEELDVLAQIAKCDTNYRALQLTPDWVGTNLEHVIRHREAFTLLRNRSELSIQQGRSEAAAGDIVEILRITSSMGDEPFSIAQLVRVAGGLMARDSFQRLLGHGQIGDDTLRRLQAAFDAESRHDHFNAGMRGERAGCHHFMTNLAGGLFDAKTLNPLTRVGERKFKSEVPVNHAFLIRYYGSCIAVTKLPTWERLPVMRELEASLPPAESQSKLSRLLLPNAATLLEADLRFHALLRSASVAAGCERFRLKTGRWPNDLAELAPAFLAGPPIDPLTGTPLLVRRHTDGITVYSVGLDGRDDGGNLWVAGKASAGFDLGFRLWNPESRGLPSPKREPELITFPHELMEID